MINLVERAPIRSKIGATLMPQHATYTYFQVCNKKGEVINPFLFCLPVAKHPEDVLAVRRAMINPGRRFFYGSDTAPWELLDGSPEIFGKKFATIPAAGICSSLAGPATIVEVFDEEDYLESAEIFMSINGPLFYGREPSDEIITFRREPWIPPRVLHNVYQFRGGEEVQWKLIV